MEAIAFLMMIWGVLVTVFWMVCAWRAMIAHEKIAEAVSQMQRGGQQPRQY